MKAVSISYWLFIDEWPELAHCDYSAMLTACNKAVTHGQLGAGGRDRPDRPMTGLRPLLPVASR